MFYIFIFCIICMNLSLGNNNERKTAARLCFIESNHYLFHFCFSSPDPSLGIAGKRTIQTNREHKIPFQSTVSVFIQLFRFQWKTMKWNKIQLTSTVSHNGLRSNKKIKCNILSTVVPTCYELWNYWETKISIYLKWPRHNCSKIPK